METASQLYYLVDQEFEYLHMLLKEDEDNIDTGQHDHLLDL